LDSISTQRSRYADAHQPSFVHDVNYSSSRAPYRHDILLMAADYLTTRTNWNSRIENDGE